MTFPTEPLNQPVPRPQRVPQSERASEAEAWWIDADHGRRRARRLAALGAIVFVLSGLVWVLITDLVLYLLVHDPVLIGRLETAKGWLFVLLGAGIVYLVILRWASRLARARATAAAILQSIADGVVIVGHDRTIAYGNAAAIRILGFEDPSEIVGMGASEFSRRFRVSYLDGSVVPPDDYAASRVFDEPGPLRYRVSVHVPGGDDIVVSSTASAVRCSPGETADLVVAVFHDVTEHVRLERVRDEFFAAAAHSLKTPVAILKAHAQMLSRRAGEGWPRSTEAIARNASRIDRLVQNLLVLARARSGTLRLLSEEVMLGPLVTEVARHMATASRDHEVRLELHADPLVLGDRERLAILFEDVIEDCFGLSVPGTPLTLLLDENHHYAEITVRYARLPSDDERLEWSRDHDDLGVRRHVAGVIAQAHGGTVEETCARDDAAACIRIPMR
jgi:signal transduction histidine kinase